MFRAAATTPELQSEEPGWGQDSGDQASGLSWVKCCGRHQAILAEPRPHR